MEHFFGWYVINMLAAYMDFGIGIWIAARWWIDGFKSRPSFNILFLGCALALLPDSDIVWPIISAHDFGDHHQTLTHSPAFMLPIAPAIAWFVGAVRSMIRRDVSWTRGGNRFWLLAFTCVLWHFIHDSPPLGGGIRWLWPLSNIYYNLWGTPIHTGNGGTIIEMWSRATGFTLWELSIGTLALFDAARILRSRTYVLLGSSIATGVWLFAFIVWNPTHFAMTAIAHP